MRKNIFEEAYKEIQEAKKAYNAAEEACDTEGQDAARVLYNKAAASLEGLTGVDITIWRAYEAARDCGNEYLDLNDNISDEEVSELVTSMKDYGIEAFTFSSTWSSAVETAWLFQQAGCTLAGLVEINSQYKAFMSNEYEKAHGYLFKLS